MVFNRPGSTVVQEHLDIRKKGMKAEGVKSNLNQLNPSFSNFQYLLKDRNTTLSFCKARF